MIGLFITARFAASRLPGKVLMPVCGKPLLELLIERVRHATTIDKVILCTTCEAEDDRVAAVGKNVGIEVFRGETDDVLMRYLGAAKYYGVKHIVVADGDDPFCEPRMVEQVAEMLIAGKAEFVQVKGMPYGTFPYGMSTRALQKVCEIKDEADTEGWGRYFTQQGLFQVATLKPPARWAHPEYRLTLDYEEDMVLVRELYERLYRPGRIVELDDLFDLLAREPALADINIGRQAEYLRRFSEKYSHVKLKSANSDSA